MKNFIHRLRGIYAATILMLVMFSTAASITAQQISYPQRKPISNQYETYSQMWNYNSTNWYFGTVTFASGSGVPNSSNYGRQLDSSTSTLTLGTSRLTAGIVNADSVILQPTPGYGEITFTASVLRVGTAPTVNATVISSSDGFVWAAVPGFTVATLTPTSLTVPVTYKWAAALATDRFYAINYTNVGSDSYSGQAWYYYQRIYGISLQK